MDCCSRGGTVGLALVLLAFGAGPISASAGDVVEQSLGAACDPKLSEAMGGDVDDAARLADELVEERPRDLYCLAARGEIFLLQKNSFWALSRLQAALDIARSELPPDHWATIRVRLLLCAALTASGQWEEAAAHCQAPAGATDGERALFDYYAGVGAFRSGDNLGAVAALESGSVRNLPRGFGTSARRFMELAIGGLARVRPGGSLTVGGGAAYDSNALMAPEDATLVGIESDVASWRSQLWAGAGYTPRNMGRYVLNGRVDIQRSFHHSSPADSINATGVSGALSAQRFGVVGGLKQALDARYSYRLTFLDGGTATLEKDFFAFVESHSVSIGPSFWGRSGHGFSLRYFGGYQRFAELVRTGFAHTLSAGEEYRLTDTLSVAIAQSASLTQAGRAYDRFGYSLGTFVAWAPHPRWVLAVRGTLQYEDYYDSTGYFDDVDRRVDWPYMAHGEVEFVLGSGFSLGAFGGVSGRVSSIETLDYDKWEAGTTMNWSFHGGSQ